MNKQTRNGHRCFTLWLWFALSSLNPRSSSPQERGHKGKRGEGAERGEKGAIQFPIAAKEKEQTNDKQKERKKAKTFKPKKQNKNTHNRQKQQLHHKDSHAVTTTTEVLRSVTVKGPPHEKNDEQDGRSKERGSQNPNRNRNINVLRIVGTTGCRSSFSFPT